LALLLAFGVAVAVGLLRGLRSATLPERGVIAAAAGVAAYFLAHGSFDWVEAYPVLAGPAFAMLFVALRVRSRTGAAERTPTGGEERTRRSVRIPVPLMAVAGTVAALAAAWSLLIPWLSVRYQERAVKVWRTDAAAAYRDLDRAASIDPLTVGPMLAKGIIAVERGELRRARAAFDDALAREDDWIAHYELALLDAAAGDRGAAMRQLVRAERLNPKDRLIPAAREEIRSAGRIDPRELTRRLFESPLFITRRLS
jgi:tetratricopeptide (TPR) repeat protein